MPVSQTVCLIKANADGHLLSLCSLGAVPFLTQLQLNSFSKYSKNSLKAWTKSRFLGFLLAGYDCPSLPSEQTVGRTPHQALGGFQADTSTGRYPGTVSLWCCLLRFGAGARHTEELRRFVWPILLPVEWEQGFFCHFLSVLCKMHFNS